MDDHGGHGHGHSEHRHEHHDHAHGHHHGHEGGHAHPYHVDSLRNNDALYADVYSQIVRWLAPPPDAVMLDAGCGAGGFTKLLAEAAPNGRVVALDEGEEMLEATRGLAEASGVRGRVITRRGDIQEGSLPEERFDIAWSSRTVHHLRDQLAGVRRLADLLKPGGRLVLREGMTNSRFLPEDLGIGERGLEARLEVAFHQWFSANVRGDGVPYPFGWTQMLRDAGLSDVTARTFLLEALPPFTDAQVRYMSQHLKRWLDDEDRRSALTSEDIATLERLTDPASDHFVFARPDLQLVETVTVYVGRKPE
ncbi:MAG: methyltransferase domain-containing protein [Dehalococcoidia bacterium]